MDFGSHENPNRLAAFELADEAVELFYAATALDERAHALALLEKARELLHAGSRSSA